MELYARKDIISFLILAVITASLLIVQKGTTLRSMLVESFIVNPSFSPSFRRNAESLATDNEVVDLHPIPN